LPPGSAQEVRHGASLSPDLVNDAYVVEEDEATTGAERLADEGRFVA
jgi:hypothetical protein